ncbi:MAG TPA: alternative ribosome rescue aminoacyl-tRNA hydrolase ArfB [Bacteroidia bacterium]|nr:alternative ribosome rescue aminoacyl-tRNA hydrolase ArfB [Bacteroidia bacterium]
MNNLSNAIVTEFYFSTSRSGGKGGQHINTTESKVELKFNIAASHYLSLEEKEWLLQKLHNKLDTEGFLRVYESGGRSQHDNKEKLIKKTFALLQAALKKPKKRKPTKVSKAAKAKRIDSKKKRGDIKKLRSKGFDI